MSQVSKHFRNNNELEESGRIGEGQMKNERPTTHPCRLYGLFLTYCFTNAVFKRGVDLLTERMSAQQDLQSPKRYS